MQGWPEFPASIITGSIYFSVTLPDGEHLATPRDGIPYQFAWVRPDQHGIQQMRQRLRRQLLEPNNRGFDLVLHTHLASDEIASAVTCAELISGIKQRDQHERTSIWNYINKNYATRKEVIDFCVEFIAARDRFLLLDLVNAHDVKDARLIEPLRQWIREDTDPFYSSHLAVEILHRHRDLIG